MTNSDRTKKVVTNDIIRASTMMILTNSHETKLKATRLHQLIEFVEDSSEFIFDVRNSVTCQHTGINYGRYRGAQESSKFYCF